MISTRKMASLDIHICRQTTVPVGFRLAYSSKPHTIQMFLHPESKGSVDAGETLAMVKQCAQNIYMAFKMIKGIGVE